MRHRDCRLLYSLMCGESLTAEGENKAGIQRKEEIQRESCDNITHSDFPVGLNESLLHGLAEYDVNILSVHTSFCLSQFELYVSVTYNQKRLNREDDIHYRGSQLQADLGSYILILRPHSPQASFSKAISLALSLLHPTNNL